MKKFSIDDIPEFSKRERIVVVGVIGKSPYRYPNKTTPLLSDVESKQNGIECHWDERRGILFLHAVTYLDTQRLAELTATLDENSKSTDKNADAAHWLVASGELAMESCRALALVFHLSHIVVLSSPTSVFDLGYLQIFKAIDAFRTELLPQATEALISAGAGGAFETHGRSCCPRLLFHFRRAPSQLLHNYPALKRLEHAVEDQLYFILRKVRIITNVCAKSLFAIPKNEEFVYMSTDDEVGNARDVSSLIRGLVQLCNGAPGAEPEGRQGFKQFLQGHVDLAFGEGFDDNVGKFAMTTSFFELPSASSWRTAAHALVPLYLEQSPDDGESENAANKSLYDALATDVRFSEARCAKVLPIAQAAYTEGLPPHYSSQHHAHKLGVAESVLESMARGPRAGGARTALRAACRAVWRARRWCEAPSLTGHPCIEPEHDNNKEHSSGVRYVSACNCGRSKCSREDPYTVRRANYTFYTLAADDCGVCNTLQAIEFPVFQPSTPTYRAASVKGGSSQDDKELSEARGSDTGSGSQGWSPDALSPGSQKDDEDNDAAEEKYLVPLRQDAHTDKVMTRQPSTTEYLPGMLHTASPAGLLPSFSSWSLVCLGPSSLYSHSLGLPEHLQPGLLPHTNYLLPWDCAVRMESFGVWRGGRGRGRSAASHLTVKIFIGFEYECPRGHRVMMSSPVAAVCGGGGGGAGAGGGGAALSKSDMPVSVWCVCRAASASPLAAHLARIHVVTPKAPVHVTLDPRDARSSGGGGSRENRRSLADILGFDVASFEPTAVPKLNNRDECVDEWRWEEPGSPELAQTPRSRVPSGCFPPRHTTAFASYSESARPGSGWSDDNNGQGITDIVASLKALAMPAGGGRRLDSAATQRGYGLDGENKNDWSWCVEPALPTPARDDSRQISRRASFCGVLTSGRNGSEALSWGGVLPARCTDFNAEFSPKVFLGGLPWDMPESAIMNTLKQFSPVRAECPGRGFAYVTLESSRCVRALLAASRADRNAYFYRVHTRNKRFKEVEVIPWAVSDASWVRVSGAGGGGAGGGAGAGGARLSPSRTVFVGALHGMLSAHALAAIMNDLFTGVVYAGIDLDKNKYPIGSGRVTFDNARSYVRAISAQYVEIITDKFSKKVQIDPYLEDTMCSVCNLHQGPYFCREPVCFRYFCRSCWAWQHPSTSAWQHRPLMRCSKGAPPTAPPAGPAAPPLPSTQPPQHAAPPPPHPPTDYAFYGAGCSASSNDSPPASASSSGMSTEPADDSAPVGWLQ